MTLPEKILAYNRANRAVAILCNHQRAAPKTFEKSMQLLQEKVRQYLLRSPCSEELILQSGHTTHVCTDSCQVILY